MNIIKKIALAAAVLCAATAANAEDGMRIGARAGYSYQMVGPYDGGLAGIGAGVAVNIPAGPVVIAPELAFLYRENIAKLWAQQGTGILDIKEVSQTEMAISVPIIVKYAFGDMFAGAGIQVDLPLAAKLGDDDMDGKEVKDASGTVVYRHWERATIDLGIPFVFGYNVMPNLAVDLRYVWGLLAHSKYNLTLLGVPIEYKNDPLSILGVNATYFF